MVINEHTLLIFAPIILGIINFFLPSLFRKIMSVLVMIFMLVLNFRLFANNPAPIYCFVYKSISMDQLSLFMMTFIQIIGFIILLYSLNSLEDKQERFYFALFGIIIGCSNGVVLAVNAVEVVVFWGLTGIILYLFAIMGQDKDAAKVAKKTFLIVGGSDVFLILGFVLLRFLKYSNGWKLWNLQIGLEGELAYVAFFSLLIAAFAKAGGFPLHTWVPDFSKTAPIEGVALLPATLDKLLGIYLLARIVMSIFVVGPGIHLFFLTIGALTVIVAVMMAMMQHNGRKLLGYHAVSQVGYMIMGVGGGSILALAGGLFHLVNNTIYKTGLFLTLGSVEKQTGTSDLEELGGLGNKMPLTFVFALICALSISGIPPFNGFFSKWMIYQGVLEKIAGLSPFFQLWGLLCLILAIFGSALTLASFMKFIYAIFLGRAGDDVKDAEEAPAFQWIATGLLALMCITFGLAAMKLPLKKLIYPVLADLGLTRPVLPGTFQPVNLIVMVLIGVILAWLVYRLTRKIKEDDIYLGGHDADPKYRIAGTEFYNEVRDMKPLNTMYSWAEQKYFDIYDLGRNCSLGIAALLKKAHNGQLQIYNLIILIGLLILLWLVKG